MKALGFRGKFILSAVLLVIAVNLAAGLYLERQLRESTTARVEAELERHAEVTAAVIDTSDAPWSPEGMDGLADKLAASADARVTVVDADGTVLGDSALSVAEVHDAPNHASRPEIVAAINGRGDRTVRRHSDTLGHERVYVAVPFTRDGRQGAVRVSLPASDLSEAVYAQRLTLFVAGLVSVVTALSLGLGLSGFMAPAARPTQRGRQDHGGHRSPVVGGGPTQVANGERSVPCPRFVHGSHAGARTNADGPGRAARPAQDGAQLDGRWSHRHRRDPEDPGVQPFGGGPAGGSGAYAGQELARGGAPSPSSPTPSIWPWPDGRPQWRCRCTSRSDASAYAPHLAPRVRVRCWCCTMSARSVASRRFGRTSSPTSPTSCAPPSASSRPTSRHCSTAGPSTSPTLHGDSSTP